MRTPTIKKTLREANISLEGLEIRSDQITICLGYCEENGFGSCDEALVQQTWNKINKALPSFNGGFYTRYGAFIAKENYTSPGDWNDKSSSWHY